MKRFACFLLTVLVLAAVPMGAFALSAPVIATDARVYPADSLVDLTWDEIEDAASYSVFVSVYPYGESRLIVDDSTQETSYSAVFQPGRYRANIRALTESGKKSAISNTVYFTVSASDSIETMSTSTGEVTFLWPVKDDPSYSGSSFAVTAMDIYFDGGDHGKLQNALDINHDGMKTRYDTREIVAVADGTVIDIYSCGHGGLFCSTRNCEGTYIKIRHSVTDPATGEPFECISFYTHLDPKTVTVKEGETVEQGQTIAMMGSSGNSSGVHLHFAIRSADNKDLPTLEFYMNDYYMPLLQFKYFTSKKGAFAATNGEKSRYGDWISEYYTYSSSKGRWVYAAD